MRQRRSHSWRWSAHLSLPALGIAPLGLATPGHRVSVRPFAAASFPLMGPIRIRAPFRSPPPFVSSSAPRALGSDLSRARAPLGVLRASRAGGGVAWSHLHKTTSARAPSIRAASFRTATATRAGLATAPAPFPRPLPRALRSILACTGAPQGVVCAARGALHAPHMRRITYRVNRAQ